MNDSFELDEMAIKKTLLTVIHMLSISEKTESAKIFVLAIRKTSEVLKFITESEKFITINDLELNENTTVENIIATFWSTVSYEIFSKFIIDVAASTDILKRSLEMLLNSFDVASFDDLDVNISSNNEISVLEMFEKSIECYNSTRQFEKNEIEMFKEKLMFVFNFNKKIKFLNELSEEEKANFFKRAKIISERFIRTHESEILELFEKSLEKHFDEQFLEVINDVKISILVGLTRLFNALIENIQKNSRIKKSKVDNVLKINIQNKEIVSNIKDFFSKN